MVEKRKLYFWYFVLIYLIVVGGFFLVSRANSAPVNYTNISAMYQEPRLDYDFSQAKISGTINGTEVVDLRITGMTNAQVDFYGSDIFLQCLICITVFLGFTMAFVFIIMMFLILRWWYEK